MSTGLNTDLLSLARALGGEVRKGNVLAPGPGHSAVDRSMSVKLDPKAPDGFVVHSFATDEINECRDYVRQKICAEPFKPSRQNGQKRKQATDEEIDAALRAAFAKQQEGSRRKEVATYPYYDQDGTLLYETVRYDPKDFGYRHRNSEGRWTYTAGTERRVIYRWPDLLKWPDATVFVCEGEKDADRVASLNQCATTVASGKWTDDCIKALAGRDCLILEDNDDAGRTKALNAATALCGTAKTVRIVRLPGLAERDDVSDWLDADLQKNTFERLCNICFDTPLWESSAETKAEQRHGEQAKQEEPKQPQALPPLVWIKMSNWDEEPVPERKWAILNRVPANQAGLFSGEGGTGKSITELMKDIAHVAGKDWLGSMPETGPAFYIGAEDSADELHIRLAAIAAHYGVTFKELVDGGLHVLCLLGQDATLCAARPKSGTVETTQLYKRLYQAAGDIRPKNISVDTLSRAFAGSEIDRVQVYAFAMHMQALAMVTNGGSVTVLSHPSLAGIASGSGISGSTAWHGAFRFRQYLTGIKPEIGEQPDNDVRQIEFKKNQYGPIGETIVLRYRNGLFLPEAGASSLDKLAREARVDEVFLQGLQQLIRQGRDAMAGQTSPEFGPTLIAELPDAKRESVRKKELAEAMTRLLAANKIHVGKTDGPASKAKKCLRQGAAPQGGSHDASK
jgi:RecA-family ATPase